MHKEDGSYTTLKEPFYRIISTRCPRVNLYEKIAPDEDLEILTHIEMRTNPRIREEYDETNFIKKEDKYTGKNAFLVDSAFLYHDPTKTTRFSNGTFGVFYCAKELECAIEETKYHTLKFAQATDEKIYNPQKSVLLGTFQGTLYDIRDKKLPEIYSTEDYSQSQILGAKIKKNEDDGIVYDSVRYKGGTCYAILKPSAIKKIKEVKCLNYTLENGKITVKEVETT